MENPRVVTPTERIGFKGALVEREPRDTAQATEDTHNNGITGDVILSGFPLALVFSAFIMATSLGSLDQTILSTSLPIIASRFHAVSDLSWIASAYFLPQSGFLLFYGELLRIAPPKIIFLMTVVIFELGSLFCAIAPSVEFLIFGRAVAGLGGAGIYVAILAILARVTEIEKRPLFMSVMGAVFAIISVVGPLIGGAFSDHLTWRWCFYINLPIGGIAFVVAMLTLPNLPALQPKKSLRAWLELDWLGTFLSVAATTFLLTALQWGGDTKPWNNPLVIGFLCAAVVMFSLFLVSQHRQGTNALLPLDMFMRRNILGACIESFFLQFAFFMAIYYLPLLYQLKGHSATKSGIDILPFIISGLIASVVAGGVVSVKGYAWPFLLFSPLIALAAFVLLFTVLPTTTSAALLGYQILLGIGLGAASQFTTVVAQVEYSDRPESVPVATSLVTFMQRLGSSIGLAIAGSVFSGQLRHQLRVLIPGLSPETRSQVLGSVTAVLSLPTGTKKLVTLSYVRAIDAVFVIGIVIAGCSSVAAVLIRRDRISSTQTITKE